MASSGGMSVMGTACHLLTFWSHTPQLRLTPVSYCSRFDPTPWLGQGRRPSAGGGERPHAGPLAAGEGAWCCRRDEILRRHAAGA